MNIEEDKKQIFVSTVCPICGFCKNPDPEFCALLYYNGDGDQFIREIVKRITKLKEVSPDSLEILYTFEGFSSLFCRENRCPLYDERCETKLSSRITCYRSFMRQSDIRLPLFNLSNVYKKWSGISLREIGKDLDPIIDLSEKLTKGKRKKLRKAIKKIRKEINKGDAKNINSINNKLIRNKTTVLHRNTNRTKKVAETLFFCNSNDEWKEKISKYLEKDE